MIQLAAPAVETKLNPTVEALQIDQSSKTDKSLAWVLPDILSTNASFDPRLTNCVWPYSRDGICKAAALCELHGAADELTFEVRSSYLTHTTNAQRLLVYIYDTCGCQVVFDLHVHFITNICVKRFIQTHASVKLGVSIDVGIGTLVCWLARSCQPLLWMTFKAQRSMDNFLNRRARHQIML